MNRSAGAEGKRKTSRTQAQDRKKGKTEAGEPDFDSEDMYRRLGVAEDADGKAIKNAYRKLAMKWHPDKVSADQKDAADKNFKNIAQAYEILSDDSKRKQYDRQKNNSGFDFDDFFSHSHGGGGFNANDIFKEFFGGRDPFADMFRNDGFGSFGSFGGFDDDFFSGGFGGGGASYFTSSSSTFGVGGGGRSESTSIYYDSSGRKVTKKSVTVNGKTTTTETVEGGTGAQTGRLTQGEGRLSRGEARRGRRRRRSAFDDFDSFGGFGWDEF